MTAGLMQDWPLTIDKILDHAARWHGDVEVVSRSVEGPITRTRYSDVHIRAKRLSRCLLDLGIKTGDRVATLAWNTGRHLEAWYGIMGIGAICHTLNPRLFAEQLCYIINHAEDRILLLDTSFLPFLRQHRASLPTVQHVIILTDEMNMPEDEAGDMLCFETLLKQASPDCDWGGFDENMAAGLCYTSGTTGRPKGVLYSHRSYFLHTLATLGTDLLGFSARDTVMAVVPMFHANAWGVPFSAPAAGARLVLPGPRLDGASIHALLQEEEVSYSLAVPTVWQMLLEHLRATGGQLDHLKRVLIGGTALPEAILRAFRDEFGVEILHGWGMTEMSPLGTLTALNHPTRTAEGEEEIRLKLAQGRPPIGVEMILVDDEERPLPHDGATAGRLKVRGPWVARGYFNGESHILDEQGFFDTGDIATIDRHGFMQVTDRAKDLIKSGGEWISSIQIENMAASHAAAASCAVIGVEHPKWDERPLLLMKLKEGARADKADVLGFLEGKIARWWMPDDVVFVDDIPIGPTGKVDKKLLRDRLKDYVLPTV